MQHIGDNPADRLLVVAGSTVFSASEPLCGGKARNLAWLSRNGFPVPPWMVVTTEAFQMHLEQAGLAEQLRTVLAGYPDIDGLAALREELVALPLPAQVEGALHEQWAALRQSDDDRFAVRSSAVGEDAVGASFAGQMDSFLYQQTFADIHHRVRCCMASAFSDRAIHYRHQAGIPCDDIRCAVIVQRMIAGDVSGVLFTAHPVTGSRRHALLSANYGAGEGIVSGRCVTDEFTIDLEQETVLSSIHDKDEMMVFDQLTGSGVKAVAVESERRNRPCLTDDAAREIATTGFAIAKAAGCPQDIEWTRRGDQVFILQTRPVTSLPYPIESKCEAIVWDNSNIEESYCGVTTPLTFSFARHAYATVYEQTMRAMGTSERLIREYQPVVNNLLGLIKGRIYYNINNWYRGLQLLPSFRQNKEDMEQMMGLQDPVDFVEDLVPTPWEKAKKLPHLALNLSRLLWAFRRLPRRIETFHHNFRVQYQTVDRPSLHTLELPELQALTVGLRQGLLERWETPIVNDFYVMMMNGRVRRWLERGKIENVNEALSGLLAGEEQIESTEPTKMLLKMAEEIRTDAELVRQVMETPDEALMDHLRGVRPDLYTLCRDYIERFGDRCVGELKLESISLRQDDAFLFAVLKSYLRNPELTLKTFHRRELETRNHAESQCVEALGTHRGSRAVRRFRKDLRKLRAGICNRENMRFARTRMFGLYRDIYLAMGEQLQGYGVLNQARDIFYLTVDELNDYFDGACVQADFAQLAALRSGEFARYEHEDLPHHFTTQGPIPLQSELTYRGPLVAEEGASCLHGTGCYPGVVTGPVRQVVDPRNQIPLEGEILCARRTDPGWAPLFPSVAGILVERGSTLSHSAVVAREFGIPAIVGIPGLMTTLSTGDRVTLDGAAGTIRLAEEGPS